MMHFYSLNINLIDLFRKIDCMINYFIYIYVCGENKEKGCIHLKIPADKKNNAYKAYLQKKMQHFHTTSYILPAAKGLKLLLNDNLLK